MTLAPIDTLEVVEELKAAGFSEQQAEAVTRAVRKAQDLDPSRLATKHDLAATKADLERRIEAVRAEKADLLKWLVPQLAGQGVATLALAVGSYLPPG